MKSAPLLLAIVLTGFGAPASAQGQRSPRPPGVILTVKGEGTAELKPDYAVFQVVVAATAPTLDGAADFHGDKTTRAVALIESLRPDGLEVQKSRFELDQGPSRRSYAGQPPAPEPPQFMASTTFSIKAKPISGLSRAISTLAASGLVQVRSVSYHVEQERSALNEARRAAMKDARGQAEVYASAGGFRLAGITAITDGEAAPSDLGQADMPAPRFVKIIPPATVSFQASVHVTWSIAPR